MKKYEFTGETKFVCGTTLHRIRAVRSFLGVMEGDVGGWIGSEKNLSHDGNCWVSDNAQVCDDAQVWGDAQVCGNALVSGDAQINTSRDLIVVGPMGSENRYASAFRTKAGFAFKVGCFYGTYEQFTEAVKSKHKDSNLAQEYLMFAEMAKLRFSN